MKDRNARILKAALEHEKLLNKELSYSEDLQNKEAIARYKENYKKVLGMLK